MLAHGQKTDFVFRRNGRVHLNRQGRQFSRLLAAEVYASAVVMLDTPCFEVVRRVLASHCIRQFPLHFSSPASPCAITFQTQSTSSSAAVRLPKHGFDYAPPLPPLSLARCLGGHRADMWVPITTAWSVRGLRVEERPAVWRVPANILSRGQPTRGGPLSWGGWARC